MNTIKNTHRHPNVEIAVCNFGPILQGTIDLRPLTVFVGPSNTGKTYLATLVYALHEVFAGGKEVLPATLEAELKNCFNLKSLSALRRLNGKQPATMTISLKFRNAAEQSFHLQAAESGVTFVSAQPASHYSPAKGYAGDRYYLPAIRSGILVSALVQADAFSARQAEFLQRMRCYKMDKKSSNGEPVHLIADALESDVLGGEILARPSPNGIPDFRYRPDGMHEEIHLSQVSSMVSELAPLVLFLRSGISPGDLLVIEEPEAHLHPETQAQMAVILARLVRTGVTVIVTTHSDWLLEEIGNQILAGMLADETGGAASWLLPQEVGAWRFQKAGPVSEIPFNSQLGIYPEDYADVADTQYNRSVNLQRMLENQKGGSGRESA